MTREMKALLKLVIKEDILFGSIIEKVLFIKNNRFGKLIINETDPEKDIYNLEVNDIAGVSSKKYIVLKVEAQ